MNRTPNFYALTISPPQRKESTRFLFGSDACSINRALSRCSKHFMIVPEYTIEDARLHYHGVFRLDDPIKWYKSVYKKLSGIGFVKVKPLIGLKNHLSWLCYCYKDWHLARVVLDLKEPIIYHKCRCRTVRYVEIPRKTILDYMDSIINDT